MKKIIPKSRLNPYKTDDRSEIFNSIRNSETALIVLEAQRAWDGLDKFRKETVRNRNYTYGNQWGDKMKGPSTGNTITEEEYIKSQGKVPLKNNMIRQLVKSVIGQFASNQTEPVCVASDRDEQKLGEMMSIIMKYLYSLNRLWDMDRRTFEKYIISGLVCHKIKYGWNSALNKEDSFVFDVDNRRLFFDNMMTDYRYWDCNLIGEIHDMSVS